MYPSGRSSAPLPKPCPFAGNALLPIPPWLWCSSEPMVRPMWFYWIALLSFCGAGALSPPSPPPGELWPAGSWKRGNWGLWKGTSSFWSAMGSPCRIVAFSPGLGGGAKGYLAEPQGAEPPKLWNNLGLLCRLLCHEAGGRYHRCGHRNAAAPAPNYAYRASPKTRR